jgi:ABC-type branched-subunit amino acid transport system substrate-binding protein
VLSFGYPARVGPGGAPTRGVVPPAGPQAARGGRAAPVGVLVSATGRYAVQGAQVRAGLELWATRAGTRLMVEDDRSQPARAARLHAELVERGCRFVLGPYGSDSARAVAAVRPGAVVWNHGAAADDVQRLPGVVSVPSPASRYLVALGRAVAGLRPAATIALVTATGRFAGFAREGLERAAPALGVRILACFSFRDPPARVAAAGADAILVCGPVGAEVGLFRALARLVPSTLRGGVSPGLAAFPALLGGDPEGLLAPVQWHPEAGTSPELGPSSEELVADARASALGGLDYVAAQAYAVALIAGRCLELGPHDRLGAARRLRTTTFFGAFELDPATGLQRGHRLSVVRWGRARQELLIAEAG